MSGGLVGVYLNIGTSEQSFLRHRHLPTDCEVVTAFVLICSGLFVNEENNPHQL